MKRIPNCIQVTLILMDESGLVIQYAEMFTNPFLHEGLSVFPWIKLPKESKIADGKNISQSELARKVGVTPQAVQKWEKAKTVPRGATLRRLADVLGVSPAYIQFGITTSVSDTFSVEQETPDYVVVQREKQDDWPFSVTREQFSRFSEEQRSLINRYIEILWQSIEKKES